MSFLVDISEEMAYGDYREVDELLDALYSIGYLDEQERSRGAEELCAAYLDRVGTTPSRLLVDDTPGYETVFMMTDMRSEERRAEGAREIPLDRALERLA